MSGFLRLPILALISTLVWSGSLHAARPVCSTLFTRYKEGAAVELEMTTSVAVINVLTTHDGKVGSLFDKDVTTAKMPQELLQWAQETYPDLKPENLEWDLLPDQLKRQLIKTVANAKETDFYDDRAIPGIKVKDVIKMDFDGPTIFLGQSYLPGYHLVDVSKVFKKVEFSSEKASRDFSGLELHMRSEDLPAGRLVLDAWAFQKGIGAPKTYLHEHILAKYPNIRRHPERAIEIAEYYRRANLLAELVAALTDGGIFTSRKWTVTFFGSARPSYFSGVYQHFSQGKLISPTTFKVAYVGFRTGTTYDREGLFGFEYRSIDAPKGKYNLSAKIADRMQYSLKNERYGFTYQDMADWMASKDLNIKNPQHVKVALESAWYHQSYTQLYKKMPKNLKDSLGKPGWALLSAYRLKISDYGNLALKILLYDWASDPIYFGDVQAQERVRNIQEHTLKNLFINPEIHPRDTVSGFVEASGILEQVGHTFGLSAWDFAGLRKE